MSPYESWPTLDEAAKMLKVEPEKIVMHHDFYESLGQLLTPTEVLYLGREFKRTSVNHVAAELIEHSQPADRAKVTEEVEEHFRTYKAPEERPEDFLARAGEHLEPYLFEEVKRAYFGS